MVLMWNNWNNWTDSNWERWLIGEPSNNPNTVTNRKVEKILYWNLEKEKLEEFIKFKKEIDHYLSEILKSLRNKICNDEYRIWHKDHIWMLNNIYKKLFPDYSKVIAWYCLIWAIPDFKEITHCDFPWEYGVMNFLNKFKEEIEQMPDMK